MLKMNDINNYLITNVGIFNTIKVNYSSVFTWLTQTISETLDMDYYLQHSGNKYISPIVDKLYLNNENTYLTKLASLIVLKFGDKWNRLYNTYFLTDYNPLENYNMIEDENVNTDISVNTSNDNNTFGFNTISTDGVSKDKSSIDTNTTGDFDNNYRKLTRSGNIGVTTSQQMLESELKLRQWDFYSMLMDDVDSVMCLAVR